MDYQCLGCGTIFEKEISALRCCNSVKELPGDAENFLTILKKENILDSITICIEYPIKETIKYKFMWKDESTSFQIFHKVGEDLLKFYKQHSLLKLYATVTYYQVMFQFSQGLEEYGYLPIKNFILKDENGKNTGKIKKERN